MYPAIQSLCELCWFLSHYGKGNRQVCLCSCSLPSASQSERPDSSRCNSWTLSASPRVDAPPGSLGKGRNSGDLGFWYTQPRFWQSPSFLGYPQTPDTHSDLGLNSFFVSQYFSGYQNIKNNMRTLHGRSF